MDNHNTAPFFIVGSGRSGSTLLRLILSAHSQVAIPPETWFILSLIEEVPLNRPLSRDEVDRSVEIITTHYRWPDMGIDTADFAAMSRKLEDPQLREILDQIYDHHLNLEGKVRWGDKTPPYIKILPELSVLYPETKFIHIVRDGHDVTKSFQDKRWSGRWLCKNLIEWKESINQYNGYKKSTLANRLYEVKYESLVLDTEATVKGVCSFLGLNFEDSMLSWGDQARNKIPERELHIHKKIFRKPQKEDTYKWKTGMSLKDIFIVESYLHKELKSSGYDVKFSEKLCSPLFLVCRCSCDSLHFCSDVGRKTISVSKKILSNSRMAG